jgi:hypothetical protein
MERFQHFCDLFADFPSLQSDLSLLDKPKKSSKFVMP